MAHLRIKNRRALIAGLLRAEFARLEASDSEKLAFLRSELARYFRRIDPKAITSQPSMRAPRNWRPHGESNPGLSLERAPS